MMVYYFENTDQRLSKTYAVSFTRKKNSYGEWLDDPKITNFYKRDWRGLVNGFTTDAYQMTTSPFDTIPLEPGWVNSEDAEIGGICTAALNKVMFVQYEALYNTLLKGVA